MRTRTMWAISLFVLCVATLNAQEPVAESPSIENVRWRTESGNLDVEIARCGDYLCGTVVRVLSNRSMSNPNKEFTPKLGTQAEGMTILSNLRKVADREWEGRIYNRENGKTYDCRLTQLNRDEIRLRAYVFVQLFGKTQIWKRVSNTAVS